MSATIHLVGNIGRAPQLRTDRNGDPYTSFGLADNRTVRDTETKKQTTETDWYNVVLFGRRATILAEHFDAGSLIQIYGRLTHRHYTNRDDQPACSLDVVAWDFDFVPSPRRRDDAQRSDDPIPVTQKAPEVSEEPPESRHLEEHPDVLIGTNPNQR